MDAKTESRRGYEQLEGLGRKRRWGKTVMTDDKVGNVDRGFKLLNYFLGFRISSIEEA